MSAQNIPHSLPDVAYGVINGNYAPCRPASPATTPSPARAPESDAAQTYANILAVRAGEESTD